MTQASIKKIPLIGRIDFKNFHWDKRSWIALIVLVVVVAGGYAGYRVYVQRQQAAQPTTPQVQTAVAREGSITVSGSGTGTLIAASQIDVGFQDSGTLSDIQVKLGDQVDAGQVLAHLQTNETPESIAAGIASAQLSVLNAQKNLDDLYANADLNAANALAAVEADQKALDDLQNPQVAQAQAQQAQANAQQALIDAQAAYDRTQTPASQANIDAAYASMILAEQRYNQAQENFQKYVNKPADDLQRAQAQSSLTSAQNSYETAVANYNAAIGPANATQQSIAAANLAAAQATLDQAQRDWDSVKNGSSPGDIAKAQAQLAADQDTYEKIKNGPTQQDIDIAQAQLTNAQAQLDLAKQTTQVEELTAPISGTVMAINGSVGESLSTGAFITLADLSHPTLQVYLDQSDLDKVAVDREADVTFDAIPDQTYTGKVTEVNPSLVSVGNVSTVSCIVQLDTSSEKIPNLTVGMTASVDVISGRAQNAVLVPVEALRQIGPDEYAVFVVTNGQLKLRPVTVGLMDLTSAQITSGLQPGEVVTTGTVQTTTSNTTGGQ